VRGAAIKKDTIGVLSACDSVRDYVLPPLGVRLEDRPSGVAVWKLEAKEDLIKEMQAKKDAEAKKRAIKEEAAKKERENLLKGKVPPEELFKSQADKFSEFDEQGVPTKDHEGNPITKSAGKKLIQQREAQEKLHKKYLEYLEKGNTVFEFSDHSSEVGETSEE